MTNGIGKDGENGEKRREEGKRRTWVRWKGARRRDEERERRRGRERRGERGKEENNPLSRKRPR